MESSPGPERREWIKKEGRENLQSDQIGRKWLWLLLESRWKSGSDRKLLFALSYASRGISFHSCRNVFTIWTKKINTPIPTHRLYKFKQQFPQNLGFVLFNGKTNFQIQILRCYKNGLKRQLLRNKFLASMIYFHCHICHFLFSCPKIVMIQHISF